MQANKKVALDTDGVLLNFIDQFAQCASQTVGRPISQQSNLYNLDSRFGLSPEEVALVWKVFGSSKQWAQLHPLDGAFDAVRQLEKAGYEIHVVTAIPEEFRDDRLGNFSKHGFTPASIHCTATGPQGKIAPLAQVDPFMYVDDRLEHLHNSLHVPVLVWIDHGEQQFPEPHGRHDVTVKSLKEWVGAFLDSEQHWHAKNAHFAEPQRPAPKFKG